MIRPFSQSRRGHLLMVMVVFNTLALLYFGAGLNRAESALRQSHVETLRTQARSLADAAIAAAQAQGAWDKALTLTLEGAGDYRYVPADTAGRFMAEGIARDPKTGLEAHCVIELVRPVSGQPPVVNSISTRFVNTTPIPHGTD